MDDEIKKLLKKNLEVSEETFRIIKKMHRAQSVSRFLKIFKWALLIALALGFYYYVQPYFDTLWETLYDLKNTFSGLKDVGDGIKDIPSGTLERVQGLFYTNGPQ